MVALIQARVVTQSRDMVTEIQQRRQTARILSHHAHCRFPTTTGFSVGIMPECAMPAISKIGAPVLVAA
jgi:hypothetical protein